MRDFHRDFDHCDPTFADSLYDITADLRSTCPVAHGEKYGSFYALSRYEDVYRAVSDVEVFSSADGVTIPSFGNPMPSWPLESDPPLATEYRAMLRPYFTVGAVAKYEPAVREIVTYLLDRVTASGRADLSQDLAIPLPAIAICHVVGMPSDRALDMVEWSNRCFEVGDPEAIAALIEFLTGQLKSRLAEPRDDLLTAIATAHMSDGPISLETAVGTTLLVVAAGFETTSNALGHLFRQLGEDKGLREKVSADLSRLPGVIEESLRFHTPLQGVARTVRRPVTIGGTELHEGDRVALLYGSANRDEERFERADVFDPERPNKQHLAFGRGQHFCLGVHLARLEMRVAVEEVMKRMPDFELDNVPPVVHRGFVRAQDQLPIVFTPSPALGAGDIGGAA